MNAEQRAAHDRIVRDLGRPDSRPHPLERILSLMADSGRALIVDDGVVIVEPLVEVEQLRRGGVML